MIKPFDFYFDFISPYSFLAHKEIRKIENKASIKVKYNPILLGGLHNLHGIKAPFIPAKAKHMIRDCKLIAERNNVKFKFNSYFPIRTLNLMRGVFVAEEDNFKNYYIDNMFNAIWQDGLNMNDENIIQRILKNLNVNPKTFALRATSSSIKDSLKKRTSEAYEKGIFGAPTFVSNNKIFWGQDRIEFVLKKLVNKLFFSLGTTLMPTSLKASNPPSTWATFLKPMSTNDLVAKADLKPKAQNKTIFLSLILFEL